MAVSRPPPAMVAPSPSWSARSSPVPAPSSSRSTKSTGSPPQPDIGLKSISLRSWDADFTTRSCTEFGTEFHGVGRLSRSARNDFYSVKLRAELRATPCQEKAAPSTHPTTSRTRAASSHPKGNETPMRLLGETESRPDTPVCNSKRSRRTNPVPRHPGSMLHRNRDRRQMHPRREQPENHQQRQRHQKHRGAEQHRRPATTDVMNPSANRGSA